MPAHGVVILASLLLFYDASSWCCHSALSLALLVGEVHSGVVVMLPFFVVVLSHIIHFQIVDTTSTAGTLLIPSSSTDRLKLFKYLNFEVPLPLQVLYS